MHYRNGKQAKDGDKIVRLGQDGKIEALGVLHSTRADGGSHCNGTIAVIQSATEYACLCDCLPIEDVGEIIVSAGFGKRPDGM